jgi:RNA polymerase sigma factor (TIGR02999 family)
MGQLSEAHKAVKLHHPLKQMDSGPPTITQLLVEWSNGDQNALDQLTPMVYDEMRRMARTYLRSERADHTLQATALVHEAYLRLIDQHSVSWQNRAHFFGIASQMMRRILVNHALAKAAEKRGGEVQKLSLDEAVSFANQREIDLIALDEALKELELLDPQQTRIVELRFFGGLSIEDTAEALRVSPATVKRDWSTAKLWLRRQLSKS